MSEKKLEDVIKAFNLSGSIVITIPKDIREATKITEGTYLRIRIENKKVILEVLE